jgi:MoaA/NifB/PqqE/SkfB family radical SAM enzyme
MDNNLKINNKLLLVLTGFSCNNNCVVCSVRTKKPFYPDRSYEELLKEMKRGRKNGFNEIEFTGGEPTVRKDIIQLVNQAKNLGYRKIAFSTNGRLFSYPEFCQEIISAGLNKITFSLLGPEGKIHEAITRTPGSFEQIIKGIKNAQQFSGIHINISSVICRLNYRNLKKFGKFVQFLGIKHWYLLDLIPDGNAQIFYDSLAVRLPKLSRELNSLIDIADDFQEFGFFDFPFCLFKPELRAKTNACFVNAKRRMDTAKQVGYNPKRISVNEKGIYSDIYREEIDVCKKCKFYRECGGIWREYLKLYGSNEVSNLAKKHNCF